MDLQEELDQLKAYIGEDNLDFVFFHGDDLEIDRLNPMEMIKRMYIKVKVTHKPTGKDFFGVSSDTQIKNAIIALKELKNELSN